MAYSENQRLFSKFQTIKIVLLFLCIYQISCYVNTINTIYINKVSYGVRKMSYGDRKLSDGVRKVSYGVIKLTDGVRKV